MTLLAPLLVLMVIGAVIAIEIEDLLSAVVAVGAVGFLLAMAFLLLGAPDLAITQLVVEVLCLVILIRATIGRRAKPVTGNRGFIGLAASGGLLIAILLISLGAMATYPTFGRSVLDRLVDVPSHTYLRESVQSTGVGNAVTAILLDFRAYDTLGEVTVLICAVIGAIAVLRPVARVGKREPGEKGEEQSHDR